MSRSDWQSTYFSEPYGEAYENYLLSTEVSEQEAVFVREVLGLEHDQGARVLDCPCGYGRHFEVLREVFEGLVGVDLSADCLERGARSLGRGAPLVRGDMRALPFAAGYFDGVVNLFNSFGYFGEAGDLAILCEFGRVLRPGGRLLIDVANPGPLLDLISDKPRTQVAVGELTLTEDWRFDRASGVLHNDTLMDFPEKSVRRSYDLRLYSLSELEALLSKAGFALVEVFGEFDGEAYDEEDSERLIVVGEKG